MAIPLRISHFLQFLILLNSISLSQQVIDPTIDKEFEALYEQLRLPGLSIAVMQHGELLYEGNFGYKDINQNIKLERGTVFHTASITKTFVAYIFGKLQSERILNLDDPVSEFKLNLGEGVKIKHLLSHTSLGTPGQIFEYNSGRFNKLDTVLFQRTGKYLAWHLNALLLNKIPLTETFPNPFDSADFSYYSGKKASEVFPLLASGYIHDSLNAPVETKLEKAFAASAGLMSTSRDLVKYSNFLMNDPEAKKIFESITEFRYNLKNEKLPYGLGWFVEEIESHKFIWHYGYMGTNSSLLILFPEKNISFAILSNSNNLSRVYPLEEASLTASSAGLLFLKFFCPEITIEYIRTFSMFYNPSVPMNPLSERIENFQKYSRYRLNYFSNRNGGDVYLPFPGSPHDAADSIIELNAYNNNDTLTKAFCVEIDKIFTILCKGEGSSQYLSDFGFITDENGSILWDMRKNEHSHAGGNVKNRIHNSSSIRLKKGNYQLHFITDESHSPAFWNNLSPEDTFWGIRLTAQNP